VGTVFTVTYGNEVKVYPVSIHGRKRWRLDITVGGVRKQAVFKTKQQAESEAAAVQEVADTGAQSLVAMAPAERAAILSVVAEAAAAGVPLRAVWEHWKRTGSRTDVPTLAAAVEALIAAKTSAGRSPRYTESLRLLLVQFMRGMEAKLVSTVAAEDVEAFMGRVALASRSTYRARLSTLFRFCTRRGWMSANPCDRLEPVRVVAAPPAVFTPEEAATALGWLKTHRPRVLGWFVLSCLCGLRPEEAERTDWQAVDLAAGLVRVEAQTSKVRQRRVVYPLPEAVEWLRAAQRAGADLPLASITRRRAIRDLREVLGWKRWPKDITRHTAASYWLARVEDAAKVAEQLGHDVRTLRRHYRALVTREQADLFWASKPL
jgi:integrase